MDTRTARFLNDLNQRFYEACMPSFSATRNAPWQGWRDCLDAVCGDIDDCALGGNGQVVRVIDSACGNMRFESFLADELGNRPCAVCAIDTSESLAREGAAAFGLPVRFDGQAPQHISADSLAAGTIRFCTRDIIACALDGRPVGFSGFDAAFCFGFFHHVPGRRARIDVLERLIACVRPGGVVAISLWRFADDERLARKALATSEKARAELSGALDFEALEEGDHFLGWQDESGVYRYAHSFSDADADELVDAVSDDARLLKRFRADGRTGALNEYLVLRAV